MVDNTARYACHAKLIRQNKLLKSEILYYQAQAGGCQTGFMKGEGKDARHEAK
jgi:hypothetical protein